MKNLFEAIPSAGADEEIIPLLTANAARVERIVSQGHASPEGFWYDQPQHEWVVLLRGAARLRFVDRTLELRPGDTVNIAAGERHRVEWTAPDQPTIWLAIFYE